MGYGSEEDFNSESGEFEPGYSHESSLNFSNMGQLHDTPVFLNGLSHQSSVVPTIIEEMTNECVSDNDLVSSQDQDEADMFFSCADWETQIKLSQMTYEDAVNQIQEFSTPAPCKRVAKLMEKMGCNTDHQNDISKLLSKRSRPGSKTKPFSPKKAPRPAALNLQEAKEQSSSVSRDAQPFQDLCLSPMGLASAIPK
jgi:hypothetical protein